MMKWWKKSVTCEQNAHSSSSNKVSNIYTPQLLSALERTKCSDRNAIYTIDAVLKASGNNEGSHRWPENRPIIVSGKWYFIYTKKM